MNVDSLMMCIIPYYETVLFIRILQIMEIKDEKSPWHWLQAAQNAGVAIPKQVVFKHWETNTWFRNFLAKYLTKMMKVRVYFDYSFLF